MANQRGRNAGVTNLIDLPGLAAKFVVRVYTTKERLSVSSKKRQGRNSTGKWAGSRPMVASGSFACSGKMRIDASPLPSDWRGQEGTLTVQYDMGKTQTIPIRVEGMAADFNETSEDYQDISLSCSIIGTPTFTGFGTPPTATEPTKADQTQWDGTSKTLDPKDLQSAATTFIDAWGSLANTDDAEATRLASVIAAALAPLAGMKIRAATFIRDSDDGGTVQVTWGRTTTAEDVINAASETTIDPRGLASQATTAAINATPPSAGIGFKVRGVTTTELNDGNALQKSEQGLRDTKDDVEFDGTHTKADPFLLEAGGQITVQTATLSPPAVPSPPTPGAVYVDTLTRQLVPGQYSHTFLYGPRTSADDAILPHTWTLADPGDLDSEGEVAAIGSIPAVPSPYYNRGVTGHYLTSGRILYVMKFGRRSTTQDHEMTHTVSEGTPFGGLETSFATVINSSLSVDFVASANYSTDVSFAGVSARALNDSKVLLIKKVRDNPRIINFQMRSPGEEPVRGYVNGSDVMVYVRQKFQRANGWEFELAMQPMTVLRMRFGIRKRVTGSPMPMMWSLTGNTNAAVFLGLAAGSVAYRGIDGMDNFSNNGPAEIMHQCEYLAIGVDGAQKTGHIRFNKANMGWHFTTIDLSAIVAGTWVKATSLGDGSTAFDSAPLPSTDFSGLTA